jgi:hypothetical protein
MSRFLKILVLAVATTAVAVPSHAFAETVLPPGNSAVNQYTQTLPTPKGNVSVEGDSIGQPNKVLGHKNTKKLDQEGEDGRAAAELAAATSPSPDSGDGDSTGKSGSGDDKEGSQGGNGGSGAGNGGSGNGNGGGGSGGSSGGSGSGGGSGTATSTVSFDASSAQGSSGLGTVLGQATGSSTSGGLGLLMPLAIVLGLIWCMVYLWRQRQTVA